MPSQIHKRPYTRLTRSDVGVLLKLRADGLTQTQIAQRLGCDQATVSKWCTDCADTTDTAKAFLRGQALRMAQDIVRNGRPADKVVTLKGLAVLADDPRPGLVIQVGAGADVKIALLSPPSAQVLGETAPNRQAIDQSPISSVMLPNSDQ